MQFMKIAISQTKAPNHQTSNHFLKSQYVKPDPKSVFRVTIIIREVVVENVDDLESMLPEDKIEENKGGKLPLVN